MNPTVYDRNQQRNPPVPATPDTQDRSARRQYRMELIAVVRGLETLTRPSAIELFTDSVYVGKGLAEWMPKWKANGWRRKERNSWAPVKNEDLWRQLDELIRRHRVKYTRVAGHSGLDIDDRCEGFVLHPHAVERILGAIPVSGNDDGDRLADEPYLVDRKRMPRRRAERGLFQS